MSHVSVKQLAMMACLGAFSLVAPPAQAETVVNEVFPIVFSTFVPCANDGAGEVVTFFGNLHETFQVTFNNDGGIHVKMDSNFQGVSGEGETTGLKYQATGGLGQDEFNTHAGMEETSILNFRVIGQGPNNNFLVHLTFHTTVNANGTVTSTVVNSSVECQ
jgi:hypothetical protein